jgi:hypothetical protein
MTKINQTKPITIQTQSQENVIHSTETNSSFSDGLFVPITISLLAISAIALFLQKEVIQKAGATHFSLPPSKIPCQHCYFFSKNSLLKCAVHPTTAMTTEAVGCSDFCAHRQKR